MSDEQHSGMEPDDAYKSGRAKDSAPDEPQQGGEDTEGHSRGLKAREDDDTEGHGRRM
ncbi:hypothetical protein BH23CHL7_BH23CHL7_05060 [soil metagenome]